MSRLLRAILFRYRYGSVEGFFGGGKSYSTVKEARYEIRSSKHNILMIYATPLRKLRDFIAEAWLGDLGETELFIYKAHDEICSDLASMLSNEGTGSWEDIYADGGNVDNMVSYYRALAKHLSESTTCLYRDHMNNLREFMELIDTSRIIVTTHDLGIAVTLMAHVKKIPYVSIFDEAEDYLEKISRPFNKHEIEALRDVDPLIYNKVKQFFQEKDGFYWIRFTNMHLILNNVIITATMPRSLHMFLEHKYVSARGRHVPRYRVNTPKSSDIVYVLKQIIPSLRINDMTLHMQVSKLIEYGVDTYGAVGVIAKNKMHERVLYELFKASGYKVSSEVYDEKPDPDAQVYILTPRGKWYRGVSIYNRRTGRDIPFIVAFYQGGKPTTIHPVFHNILAMIGGEDMMYDDARVFSMYSREMNYASNLQALYRYNRVRRNKHIMVLLDERWVHAYRYYHPRKWKEMKRQYFTSLKELINNIRNA